jgi:aspartyl-tRNA synthetase
MFEWDEAEQRLVAMHHPFTAPNPADLAAGNGAGLRHARALAYDLVYNGVEIAGAQKHPWLHCSCHRPHAQDNGE